MAITQITGPNSLSQQTSEGAVDVVAIHDLDEDSIQTWTHPTSKVSWLSDILTENLHHARILVYSYKAEAFTSPGIGSTKSILNHANNLVAELCADRQLENAFDRPIIFICHGFGGLLLKRALAYSNSREDKGVEHLRSIFTCTYGILFLGTPHNGISKETLLSQGRHNTGPSHFMLSLLKGSEMMNEINDQFAPLMKQFAIFNFWEELETQCGTDNFYVVDQESAAPAWDNVERCGIMATHSTMTKFENRHDRRFRPILEALSRYTRSASAVIKLRLAKDAELMDQKRQQAIGEILHSQRHHLHQADSTPAHFNEWCLIPRKPSHYFIGRQRHAKYVRDMLGPIRNYGDHSRTKLLVILGLGGSGKTQFCLKYVEDNKHRYWGVFWVDASSNENIESGFSIIGAQAGRGATKASAMYWLSQCKQPWLLVLDNADDPDLDILNHYPGEGNGHILITTRNPNVVDHATNGHLRFRGMEPQEAVSLLLKAAYPDPQHQGPPATPARRHLAEGIAIELGYLPLAIAHAGATIRRNIYTLERYLKYYLPQRKSMLSHSRVRSVDEANIITTWEIPFQKIVSRGSVEHRDAVDLMHMFAFMHHETIPERIFQRSWHDLRSAQSSEKLCPDILEPVWSEEAQARFRRAIGILCDHSIIEYEPSKGLCTMHPVVHNWARDRLTVDEQKRWFRCTTAVLAQCISPHLEASGRQLRTLLLPHINSCLQLQKSQDSHKSQELQKSDMLKRAAEMEKFASVYAEQGQWKTANHLQDMVVGIRKKLLGKRHKDTISAESSLGQTLWNLFEVKRAVDVQKEILDVLRWHRPSISDWVVWPIWLPTHTPYCLALSEITSTLWLAGHRSISKWTGERAVEGLKKRLGPDDPLTLKAMFYLARTYLHLGEEQKCHELLIWVLRRQKRFFGMSHPDTLMTRNELGMLFCARKRYLDVAQRLVENVLETRKRILGEEHAYTLWSINDLSKIYVEKGRAAEAVAILEAIIPVVERTLGLTHVGMSMTKSNLGRAYFMSERWKEAEETIQPLLSRIMPDHPDWYHNVYAFAQIQFNLGKIEEAEKNCNDLMEKIWRTKSFAPDHHRTVSIAELLLRIYRAQGNEDKVSAILSKVPTAGEARRPELFDPYAVRKGAELSPETRKRLYSDEQSRCDSSPQQTTLSPSQSGSITQDSIPKLVARHTF
ncbi:hypothetical protein GQ44DRAFT_772490 [Phaeosphaeriaceae sp. PMI808]|nr:hypothetical protein GQ44DRAFT_772490 [Phaeosphaeriaceae sp. PMI808]